MDATVALAMAAAAVAAAAWLPDTAWHRVQGAAGEVTRGRPRGSLFARLRRERGARARADDVALVCLLLAVCLDAGRPARSSLRVVADAVDGPARQALTPVLQQIDLGIDEASAWASLATTPGYAGMARDLARSVHSGVALADLLRRHAVDARRQVVADAQVRARAVGVTGVVPVVVCFLPAFILLGIVPVFGGLVAGFLG